MVWKESATVRKKRSQNKDVPESGNWMNTYGDLVTLLLCFFVLLFSFSTIDAAKWEALVRSFSGASGIITEESPGSLRSLSQNAAQRPPDFEWHRPTDPDPVPDPDPPPQQPATLPPQPSPTTEPLPSLSPTPEPTAAPEPSKTTAAPEQTTKASTQSTTRQTTEATKPKATPTPEPELDAFYADIHRYFNDHALGDSVQVVYDGSQITVRLIASVIFEPGSDRLIPQAESILRGASDIINSYLDEIGSMRTEGHTDNRFEDESEANDAFELAAARAVRVNRFILNSSNLDGSKASVSGHGSNYPVADNSTEEGRNQNNRVDIVLSG